MVITWGKEMAGSKQFDKIAWTITVLMLILTVLFMSSSAFGLEGMDRTMGYEHRLFDNAQVHTIDIIMNNWDEFIANAASEQYYTTTVVIDGEAYKNVGIRGKGNTSLSMVSSMNSDRYSFKVEFDHYDSSITYHGLDKLSLNNLIQDTTMMKDYLTYTLMNGFGVAAPLCSFVYITVNGEDWGLYLAVEGVEESFLERNYGSNYGDLYKPDSMSFGGGRGNGKDFNMDDFMNRAIMDENTGKPAQGMTLPNMPDMGNFNPVKMPGMPQAGPGLANREHFFFGGNGASDVRLQYVDDNADSYLNIWNSAKTDITSADKRRLIESLKNLSNGEHIESVVDIDQVIRFFVVHNYVCNGDSYTGSMIHNYYLYEEDGRMAMIPWDYNLAFGTFQGGNAQSTINTPIDSPVSGGSSDDRPMWNWIVVNKEYTELYHQYFAEFLNRVDIDAIIENTHDLIKTYVEKDPTAFYSYEEFETGVDTLRRFCSLRSKSISMQLANGETVNNMGYVDGSGITLSDMGSMRMGGEFGRGSMPGDFGDEMPKALDFSQIPGGFNGRFPDPFSDKTEVASLENERGTDLWGNDNRPSRDNMQMPGGDFNFNMNSTGNPASGSTNLLWLAVSVLILGVGLIIAKAYK
jgi:spore coat protein CotH